MEKMSEIFERGKKMEVPVIRGESDGVMER